MKYFNAWMTGGALLLAASSASALQIDFNGTGNIAGSTYFQEINWGSDNTLLLDAQDIGGSLTRDATMLAQNSFQFGGAGSPRMTFQMIFPVTVSIISDTATVQTLDITKRGDGAFVMFLDDNGTLNKAAGTGYGDLNGGTLDTNERRIAEGIIDSIDPSGFSVNVIKSSTLANLSGNNSTVQTRRINGSTILNINITSQNNSWITSDLVNAGLTIDVALNDLSFNAPFGSSVLSSALVVNTAPDFGTDNKQDEACANTLLDPTCDFQVQTGTNSRFLDKRVPEPATIALGGLALTLLGFSTRRKRNQG